LTLTAENGELETLVEEENNQLAVQLTIGVLSAVDSLKENNATATNTSLVRILTIFFCGNVLRPLRFGYTVRYPIGRLPA